MQIKRTIFFTMLITIILLISARCALPSILRYFAEKKLNEIPGYKTQIESVSVHLYRGSYQINQVRLSKITANLPVPFFSADVVDFQVQWKALLQGRLVAQVKLVHPVIHFVIDPAGKNEQLTIDDQWRTIVTQLFPLPFNYLTILNGAAYFQSYNSKPPFELHIQKIQATLDNLNKVSGVSNSLFAHLKAEGIAMETATVTFNMQFNPFALQPTFLLKASVDNMNIQKANHFLQHYTKIKVSNGLFSLYIEAAAAKGKIKGYAKPLFKKLEIINPAKKASPVEYLYKEAVQFIVKVLENPKHKTVATKVKIMGNINHPNTHLFSIIGYLLRHAFIQALLPGIDHSIQMKDVMVDM
ncbi:MAG: hypothetical protein K0R24_1812 [Gammaproteobacteria bacterium]|jgi:hypothetical protein|nr:hypothetical protein [Gammaproteobacteria bacterium]